MLEKLPIPDWLTSPRAWFDRITAVIFAVILLFIAVGMCIGTVRLFFSLSDMFSATSVTDRFLHFISDILTLFVLIELSRSLVEYFNTRRLRMTFIVDAAIVFMLQEVMIKSFQHKISPDEMYAMSALLLVMGALRIGSILVFQRERRMLDALDGGPKEGEL
ncbi:MAG: phosphate-starvation-inducible PsiE family protein [Nitrospirota bacterium]|nr:phosphate-starvation-inducible PsiE family protein [Nitrospirota bacterium]